MPFATRTCGVSSSPGGLRSPPSGRTSSLSGIFAYDEGGAVAVGIARVVRMLPAALVAPFAASLGDRFRRERFLLANALVGCGALAASAVAFLAGSVVLVFVFAAVVGLASTLVRPRCRH